LKGNNYAHTGIKILVFNSNKLRQLHAQAIHFSGEISLDTPPLAADH
jgi:hypothetical protein